VQVRITVASLGRMRYRIRPVGSARQNTPPGSAARRRPDEAASFSSLKSSRSRKDQRNGVYGLVQLSPTPPGARTPSRKVKTDDDVGRGMGGVSDRIKRASVNACGVPSPVVGDVG
jgi:hypothetical protein